MHAMVCELGMSPTAKGTKTRPILHCTSYASGEKLSFHFHIKMPFSDMLINVLKGNIEYLATKFDSLQWILSYLVLAGNLCRFIFVVPVLCIEHITCINVIKIAITVFCVVRVIAWNYIQVYPATAKGLIGVILMFEWKG